METYLVSGRQRDAPRYCCRRSPEGGRLHSSPCRKGTLSSKRSSFTSQYNANSTPILPPVAHWKPPLYNGIALKASPTQGRHRGRARSWGCMRLGSAHNPPPTLRHASQTVASPSRSAAALSAAVLLSNHAPPLPHPALSLHHRRTVLALRNDGARTQTPKPCTLYPAPQTLNPEPYEREQRRMQSLLPEP